MGALLFHSKNPIKASDVAKALGWTVDRVESCLENLAQSLGACGVLLLSYSDDSVELRADSQHLDGDVLIRLSRRSAVSGGVSDRQAAVIRMLFDHEIATGSASDVVQETLKELIHAGLASESTRGAKVSRAVYLTERPFEMPTTQRGWMVK